MSACRKPVPQMASGPATRRGSWPRSTTCQPSSCPGGWFQAPSHRATGKAVRKRTALGAQHHLGVRHKHWASNSAAGVHPQESVRTAAQQLHRWCVPTGDHPGHTPSNSATGVCPQERARAHAQHYQARAATCPGRMCLERCAHTGDLYEDSAPPPRMAHVSLERKPSRKPHTQATCGAVRPAGVQRQKVRGRNNSGARGGWPRRSRAG